MRKPPRIPAIRKLRADKRRNADTENDDAIFDEREIVIGAPADKETPSDK